MNNKSYCLLCRVVGPQYPRCSYPRSGRVGALRRGVRDIEEKRSVVVWGPLRAGPTHQGTGALGVAPASDPGRVCCFRICGIAKWFKNKFLNFLLIFVFSAPADPHGNSLLNQDAGKSKIKIGIGLQVLNFMFLIP